MASLRDLLWWRTLCKCSASLFLIAWYLPFSLPPSLFHPFSLSLSLSYSQSPLSYNLSVSLIFISQQRHRQKECLLSKQIATLSFASSFMKCWFPKSPKEKLKVRKRDPRPSQLLLIAKLMKMLDLSFHNVHHFINSVYMDVLLLSIPALKLPFFKRCVTLNVMARLERWGGRWLGWGMPWSMKRRCLLTHDTETKLNNKDMNIF